MAKTGWSRFEDRNDDGYYHEPLTLAGADSGAIVREARQRERAQIVRWLLKVSHDEHQFDHSGMMVSRLADRIKEGEHYGGSASAGR